MLKNTVTIKTLALRENVSYLRSCVGAFCVPLNPTLEEIGDIKTAVSEALTNACIHAYKKNECGEVLLKCTLDNRSVSIEITDFGRGISDINQARCAFFTTESEQERSGLGFTVMETFMDSVKISNNPNGGLSVIMSKQIREPRTNIFSYEGDVSVRA